ncbi:hypothetical protein ACH492_39685 [Streptomyces sp. NPDC019443]|uniref:hypothetical protein n=1 Tax=Streptomyces sp. NPDC019443 TaxID=3365061 RepID=UPI00378CF6B2
MRLLFKGFGVTTAAAAAAFALAAPASAVEVRQRVTLASVDGDYSGSIVVETGVVKANGTIEDTGFHRGSSALYINITSTTGTYNIPFATVGNNTAYTFATRQKSFPGTFISGKATLCSWKNSGSSGSTWSCGASKTIG